MRALSIRQPYAELILRGIKTAELRSKGTSIVGERFFIYAAKGAGRRRGEVGSGEVGESTHAAPRLSTPHLPAPPFRLTSDNLTTGVPPGWMIELAEQLKLIEPELAGGAVLPTGVIVGSAVIERVTPPDPGEIGGLFRWHLVGVERAKKLRKPKGHPQPVWFRPF